MLIKFAITGAAWGGVLVVALTAVLPWMRVPGGSSAGELITLTPAAARYYHIGCAAIAGCIIIVRIVTGIWGDRLRQLAVAWFVMVLLFPYFAMVWDAKLAAQASWVQMQHENLTWLGGDVFTGLEFSDSSMKSPVYPVDPPRRLAVFRVPIGWPWDLNLSNLSDFLDWLGYTEAFCQFCCKGWILALLGTASIIVATCVMDRSRQRARIVQSIRLMATIGLVGTVVAWSLPLVTGIMVADAEKLLRAGKHELAMDRLDTAARLMPVLRHDTSFVAQIGRLGHLIGSDRVEARLYKATLLEGEGRFFEASQLYHAVIRDDPLGSPSHREACRALLRDAIHALNSGRVTAAEAELRDVLADEPTNLKAIYTLQLVYLRSGRFSELDALGERFGRIYAFFQSPVKDAVLAYTHSTDMAAALDANDPSAARRAYRSTIKP